MHNSTPPFFQFCRIAGGPSPLLLLLTIFFSLIDIEAFTQCTSCTQTYDLAIIADRNSDITVGPNQTVCIISSDGVERTYERTVTLSGTGTLCVGANVNVNSTPSLISDRRNNITIFNYGNWQRPFNMDDNGIQRIENRGEMFLNNLTINANNALFQNYGLLNITNKGNLAIVGSTSQFLNAQGAQLVVTGNLTINGGGGGGGRRQFENLGTAIVTGNFTQQNTNPESLVRGALTVNGNMSLLAGRFTVDRTIVYVNGDYTQDNSNTHVIGTNPTSLPENTACGAFRVTGTSRILGGSFGFQSTSLGMCDNEGSPTGFDQVTNDRDVAATARLKCSCLQALPITLIYFTAKQTSSQVTLQWATAAEKDNEYFSLEKSRDGKQFNEIGRVPGAGTSTTKLSYEFMDDFPFGGISYYRLKQVDLDGTFTYSRVAVVNSEVTATLRIYPNPLTQNELWVEASDAQADDMRITIHNPVGKLLVDRVYPYEPAVKVDLSTLRREPGLYIISVRRKNRIERHKLVIQ